MRYVCSKQRRSFVFGFEEDMLYRIPALLAAMTIHEYSHARAAVAMGDPTPRFLGRLTLNPIAHIDPIGLLLLFFAGFGWAKPVPINSRNFREGRKGMFIVSFAGIGANIVLAFFSWFFLLWLGNVHLIGEVWQKTLWQLYRYNLMFAVFNLIPIPPLDGSKILMALLPGRYAYEYQKLEPYGNYILIALVLIPGILTVIITPFYGVIEFVIRRLTGLLLGIIL
jgi:Zn-dependent protease